MAYIEDETIWIDDVQFTLYSFGGLGISTYEHGSNLISKRGVEELITILQTRREKFRKEDCPNV